MRKLVLLAALVTIGVSVSAKEVTVADGREIPEIRPCVDIIARGELQSVGQPERLADGNSIFSQEVYTWRFTKRDVVFGDLRESELELSRTDRELIWPEPSQVDVLVLLARRDGGIRYLGSLSLKKDEQGRVYVPILDPDHISVASRSGDWRPDALMNFAKPVSDRDVLHEPQSEEAGEPLVVARLYADDIPALMAAARAEDCWR
jgi:hypothetical protein